MITVTADTFPLAHTFTISRGSKSTAQVVTATVTRDGHHGRGEAVPYARYGETVAGVLAQIAATAPWITRESLTALHGKYDVINIKLDKTGGLTEALALKAEAQAMGFGIMVGCMVGSSLAMAPATILAQGAAFTDLDGPLLLAQDRDNPLLFDEHGIHPPHPALWG